METPEKKSNLILIGMPASGKSTLGVVLAKALGYDFLDTDLLIQNTTGKRLETLMEEHGIDGFLQLEEKINAGVSCHRTVIAPGGSVIYGPKAMAHYQEIGTILYLQVSLSDLQGRLQNMKARGVALRDGMTLEDLYRERTPLYEKYADLTITEDGRSIGKMVETITGLLKEQGKI
ncbi:MAG: shikimate kinase [Lachnospiraceae bacterium]